MSGLLRDASESEELVLLLLKLDCWKGEVSDRSVEAKLISLKIIEVDVVGGLRARSSRKWELTRVKVCIEERLRVFIRVLSLSWTVFSKNGSPVRAKCLLKSLKRLSSVSLYEVDHVRELSWLFKSWRRVSMSSSSVMRDFIVVHSALGSDLLTTSLGFVRA
jgi:hypothetical protein